VLLAVVGLVFAPAAWLKAALCALPGILLGGLTDGQLLFVTRAYRTAVAGCDAASAERALAPLCMPACTGSEAARAVRPRARGSLALLVVVTLSVLALCTARWLVGQSAFDGMVRLPVAVATALAAAVVLGRDTAQQPVQQRALQQTTPGYGLRAVIV